MNHETLEMNIDHIEGNHWDIHQNQSRVATHPPPGRPEAGPRIRQKVKTGFKIKGLRLLVTSLGTKRNPISYPLSLKIHMFFSSLMPDSSSKIL